MAHVMYKKGNVVLNHNGEIIELCVQRILPRFLP